MPYTVKEGINIFLSGFIPKENIKFREEELKFMINDTFKELNQDKLEWYHYPDMVKKQGDFTL